MALFATCNSERQVTPFECALTRVWVRRVEMRDAHLVQALNSISSFQFQHESEHQQIARSDFLWLEFLGVPQNRPIRLSAALHQLL